MSTLRRIAGLFTVLLAWPLLACAGDERPNILVLMAEDMGARVGAFGDELAQTPNLDRLAASGVRFPNTFTTAGVCAPSRAAHITGRHQGSIGAQHMRSGNSPEGPYLAVPPPEVKAYPELLRAAGYYTLTNHKLDYQFSRYGAGSGPSTIWHYEGEDPDWSRRADGQPFYALINLPMTHESRLFAKNVVKQREQGWKQVTDPSLVTVPPYYPDDPAIRRDIAQQYDNVHEMDRNVGLWLDRLEADGLLENTIVIWTTDHGDGLPRAKREIYDSGIRVPLILRLPPGSGPVGAGSEDTRLVSFVDFGPSVLTWAGAEVPAWMHGQPVLADPAVVRDYVFAAKDRLDEMPFRERAARDSRFKYIRNDRPGEPGGKPLAYREQLGSMQALHTWFEAGRMNDQQAFWFRPRPAEELYDLSVDPDEVTNLAGDPGHTATLDRLRGALAAWQDRVGDTDEPEAELAQRFWPGGEQPSTTAPEIAFADGRVMIRTATEGASLAYRLDGGDWNLYTGPFAAPATAAVEARAVRYGWQESDLARLAPRRIEWAPVALQDPRLRIEGLAALERGTGSIKLARFDDRQLQLGKPQLGFNPAKARNPAGGVVSFRSASPRLRLAFQPLEGLNRGSEFGVFAGGELLANHRFGPKDRELQFELVNPGTGPVNWAVSLPSFANVALVSLETDIRHGLLAPESPRRRIFAALGDSITHGTGQGSASHLSWPFLLSHRLGFELYNLAVGGSGVSLGQAETLAGLPPVDLVTILFGYNDWNGEGDSVQAFKNQYRQMLSQVRAAQPGATILCISPLVTRRDVSLKSGLPIDGFRQAVHDIASEWGASDPRVHFIDGTTVSSYANLKPEGEKDVVHLTVEGAALLAESLYPIVAERVQ